VRHVYIIKLESSKDETISIRINSELKKKLLNECKNNHNSMNMMINHALSEYVGWDRYMREGGWAMIFRSAFREILNLVDEKEIIRIGHQVAVNEYKSSTKYFFGNLDISSLITMITQYFDHIQVNYRHDIDDGKSKFIVKHDLGMNWAIYVISTIETLMAELGYAVKKEYPNGQCFEFEIIKTI